MSDFFGIGPSIQGAARVYFQSARQTGRSTNLINSLKPGDRVCFHDSKTAHWFRNKLHDRGIEGVTCIVVPVSEPDRIFREGTSQGRTIFDHVWLEKYFDGHIERMMKEIKYLEEQSSGYGEAHLKMKQQAKELAEKNALRWL